MDVKDCHFLGLLIDHSHLNKENYYLELGMVMAVVMVKELE